MTNSAFPAYPAVPPTPPSAVWIATRGGEGAERAAIPLVQQLQRLLASSAVLFLNYSQYSWAAGGNSSNVTNRVLGTLAASVKDTFDRLGACLTRAGVDPTVTLEGMSQWSDIKFAYPHRDHYILLYEAKANLGLLIDRLRVAVERSKKDEDLESASILNECLRLHKKHELQLRHLAGARERVPV